MIEEQIVQRLVSQGVIMHQVMNVSRPALFAALNQGRRCVNKGELIWANHWQALVVPDHSMGRFELGGSWDLKRTQESSFINPETGEEEEGLDGWRALRVSFQGEWSLRYRSASGNTDFEAFGFGSGESDEVAILGEFSPGFITLLLAAEKTAKPWWNNRQRRQFALKGEYIAQLRQLAKDWIADHSNNEWYARQVKALRGALNGTAPAITTA